MIRRIAVYPNTRPAMYDAYCDIVDASPAERVGLEDAEALLWADPLHHGVYPEAIDQDTIRAHLYDPNTPDPDLVIRTAGEMRFSNFLLWQVSYSELFVTELCWPDFREEHLVEAMTSFARRQRRFGALPGEEPSPEGGPPADAGSDDAAVR